MPNTLAIKRRLKSVGNVKQITKAMELTAAAKLHRAQSQALHARPYATRTVALVRGLASRGAGVHPLLEVRPIKNRLIILVTTDRGLAGGLNTSLIRETLAFLKKSDAQTELVLIGKKGIASLQRFKLEVLAAFTDLPAGAESVATRPISLLARDHFLHKKCDVVYVAYNHFQSTLSQKATITQLLPFTAHPETVDAAENNELEATESLIEPDASTLLNTLLPRLVDQIFFQIMLEAGASEHAARMVAMQNATDNASDLLEDLNLTFNSIRQSSITTQMAEISSSIAALEE